VGLHDGKWRGFLPLVDYSVQAASFGAMESERQQTKKKEEVGRAKHREGGKREKKRKPQNKHEPIG